jgi:hypothetical protein
MNHAWPPVRGFPGQRKCAVNGAIEWHAFVDQQLQAACALTRQIERAPFIAEPGPSRQRIAGMFLGRIARPDCCRDTAFRPKARAAVEARRLGNQRDRTRCNRQRAHQTRHTGTDHDDASISVTGFRVLRHEV